MMSVFELATDADAATDGSSGLQVHVEISPIPTPTAPVDHLASTGADLPTLLLLSAIVLIAIGSVLLVRRLRRAV